MPLKGTLSGNYTAPVTLDSTIYATPVTVTGVISLSTSGIDLLAPTAWSVVNSGRIESPGSNGTGIALDAGGSVDNLAGGTIDGARHGVALYSAAGSVTNAGSIISTLAHTGAVALDAGGTLINLAGGFISGAIAAYSYGGGTVVNAGTVVGNGSDDTAVFLAPNHANRLVIDPGAVFSGAVSGGNSVGAAFVSTLELASGASAGTLNGLGSKYIRFAALTVDAGATWDLAGYNAVAAGMTLTNSGYLADVGTLSNAGAVVGTHAVLLKAPGGLVVNSGSIGTGVSVTAYGSVSNAAGGIIAGGDWGVTVTHGGILSNAGSIIATATNGVAVQFQAGSANRVIVDPGAVFSGKVDGGNPVGAAATSVLELAAGADTLTGIGSSFTNFGSIDFDPGAAWFISGSTAALAGGQTIAGFARGDTIELTGVSAAVSGSADGTLALTGGLDLLLPDAHYSAAQFRTAENGGNTELSIACFRAGAHVLTDRGELPVETVRPGMRVVSLLHRRLLPVRWVGRRQLRCSRHPRPEALWPVRIEADAFAAGVPHCSLHLSPDHAVFTGQN